MLSVWRSMLGQMRFAYHVMLIFVFIQYERPNCVEILHLDVLWNLSFYISGVEVSFGPEVLSSVVLTHCFPNPGIVLPHPINWIWSCALRSFLLPHSPDDCSSKSLRGAFVSQRNRRSRWSKWLRLKFKAQAGTMSAKPAKVAKYVRLALEVLRWGSQPGQLISYVKGSNPLRPWRKAVIGAQVDN